MMQIVQLPHDNMGYVDHTDQEQIFPEISRSCANGLKDLDHVLIDDLCHGERATVQLHYLA